MKDRGD